MLRFEKQPSFELGIIGFEMLTGHHPLGDEYVAGGLNLTGYSVEDLPHLPAEYTTELDHLLRSLVECDPGIR